MVTIENVDRNATVLERGRMADTRWTRLRGLIGVKELTDGEGMIIKPCHGVHCMFMSIPIDVIYVDKTDRVVAVDRAMKPWAIGRIYRQSDYVIELPVGTIDQTGTQPGDQLTVTAQ